MICELSCKCALTDCENFSAMYCKGNPFLCARRRVAVTVGCENIPNDLLPGQEDRILDTILGVLEHRHFSECGSLVFPGEQHTGLMPA